MRVGAVARRSARASEGVRYAGARRGGRLSSARTGRLRPRERTAHARIANRFEERCPLNFGSAEAQLAQTRERRRARREPDNVLATHAAATFASCRGARSENF